MIRTPTLDLTPGLQAGKVLMTAGAVTLSSVAAVCSPQLSKIRHGRCAGVFLAVAILTFLLLGIILPANCHAVAASDPTHSTLSHDAVGNLFLGLAAVSTGFVLGQDEVNKRLSGRVLWTLVILLFGAGTLITSLVNANHFGYTYQYGNLAMEIGGAVLACAIAKTVFSGRTVSPQLKFCLLILFLGVGVVEPIWDSNLPSQVGEH